MSYFITRRSFHHSCFQSLIIRVPESKLGLFNYNEFAIYPPPKSTQSLLTQQPLIQSPPTHSSLVQSKPASSHILPSLPNLAIPVPYIHKSS